MNRHQNKTNCTRNNIEQCDRVSQICLNQINQFQSVNSRLQPQQKALASRNPSIVHVITLMMENFLEIARSCISCHQRDSCNKEWPDVILKSLYIAVHLCHKRISSNIKLFILNLYISTLQVKISLVFISYLIYFSTS